jgi:hypothetical protein
MNREHRKLRNKARYLRSKQSKGAGVVGLKRNAMYNDLQDVKRLARYHHLTRMMLKGVDYDRVEAFTYHRVNAQELADYAFTWWPGITEQYVYDWLGQEAS